MKLSFIERLDERFLKPNSRLIWYALVFFLLIWLVIAITRIVSAQSPQGFVKPSYVQCPPEYGHYDPTKEYKKFPRAAGTVENPRQCWEVVDKLPSGAWCQMAYYCEDAT